MSKEDMNNMLLPAHDHGMQTLMALALDLHWSWNHSSDVLWKELDPNLWELTHNPWIVLQTVSKDQLELKLADEVFSNKMNELAKSLSNNNPTPAWFQEKHPDSPLTCVAYFSMEFMLSEALPVYVGGLGNVAGDQLKSASDLGVPVVAVGLLYQQGYFRQEIDRDGNQQETFPYNDPGQLPVSPLRLANGEWLRLKIVLAGHDVWLRAWQVQVGNVRLYLLDSNDMVNLPMHRGITGELYGGGPEMRIQQEILLGAGGWKLLQALGIHPEVCHLNEGHAAFLILERARSFMKKNGVSFEAALATTRAGNLFTTHTAVAAGFDHFSSSLMFHFFGSYAEEELGIDFEKLMALGRQDTKNTSEPFNMAFLAIRGSGAINGVSRLHGEVSRHLFASLYPRWPVEEIPVGHVTNGVHMPGWDAETADSIWTQACGKNRWRGNLESLEKSILSLPDDTIWQLRTTCRNNLVNYIRIRLESQLRVAGFPSDTVDRAKNIFNAGTLTLGFARRFVPYKRPDLLLHDQERFIRILTNPRRPVQLVIAGKAPPFDESGKALIREWVHFIQQHNLHEHIVFLSDYDILLAEQLVQGADVWINTPKRPWEAAGTSGMKVLVNGGLNLSELDGWWAEAYTPEVGWALGDAQEHGDNPAWDATEAAALYSLLEQQVIPEFYEQNEKGIPVRWTERIRKSMATLTPQFSANRTVREYTEQYYIPAAAAYLKRSAKNGNAGTEIAGTQRELSGKWNDLAFKGIEVSNTANGYQFSVTVFLNGIKPENILIELYAEGSHGTPPEKISMRPDRAPVDDNLNYHAFIATSRPYEDYTVRAIPHYGNISVPLENNLIKWQR